jgi:methylated-DNA-[protein]-cysteine S-methyltransferase
VNATDSANEVRGRSNHQRPEAAPEAAPEEAPEEAEVHDLGERLRLADTTDVGTLIDDTPIGPLTLAATPDGVVRIGFGHEDLVLDELASEVSPRVVRLPARLDEVRRELEEYFAGRRHHFDVPVDRRLSRGYRRIVLEALSREVPYGQTVSYKELAERTGNPKASRAVGSAMATNPIPIVVPCHRVLRTGGALGGYGGGLDTKVWLLRHEGALLG